MEKINREELMKKFNLSEEDLEKVAGGTGTEEVCRGMCDMERDHNLAICEKHPKDSPDYTMCTNLIMTGYNNCLNLC